jgi:hypothetical protein
MKTFFLILLVQLPVLTFSQNELTTVNSNPSLIETTGIEMNPLTKKYSKSDVINIGSKPAMQLFEGTYKWLTEIKYAHSLASKGIEMDEAIFNRIRVNQYLIAEYNTEKYKIRFILTIGFKDGRYRYEYTDFVLFEGGTKTDIEEISLKSKERSLLLRKLTDEINAYINSSVAELTAYLTNYESDTSW